jgi:hypothetical protein
MLLTSHALQRLQLRHELRGNLLLLLLRRHCALRHELRRNQRLLLLHSLRRHLPWRSLTLRGWLLGRLLARLLALLRLLRLLSLLLLLLLLLALLEETECRGRDWPEQRVGHVAAR